MDRPLKVLYTLLATVTLFTLSACNDGDKGKATITNNSGSSSGGSSGGSSSGGSTNTIAAYASIQTVTSKGTAAYSNEIQIPENSPEQLSVTWEEPTRTISGDCLVEAITSYKANVGTESGTYTIVQNIALADVTCTDSGKTDTTCGKNIQNCRFTIDLSGI